MYAVLHIAAFALHAVLRTEAGDAQRPAALFSGHGKKSLVLETTSSARAGGVETGMTAPQAVARCPLLQIRSPQADAEAEARAALQAIAFTLSPMIEDTAPGVCTVDLRGTTLAQALPVVHAAQSRLGTLGLPASIGLARTPLLALYAARAADTVLVVEAQADEKQFLTTLPLAAGEPPPELAEVLHQWGLRTFGQLTALPRDEIVRRFGAAGLALWQRACGGAPRPIKPVIPPQAFAATMELEHAVETLEPLLFILRRFIDRLTLELSAAHFVAAELRLKLRQEDETTHERHFRLPEPTADGEILFRTLHAHLESVQTASAIVAAALEFTPARPLVRQQGLFETGLRDPHGFADTLARVAAIVGSDNVGTPRREDTHRPEAFKLVPPPFVIPPADESWRHAPIGPVLRRFRPPLPVQLSRLDNGPSYLWSESVRGEIAFRSPPYPRNGDWWQSDQAWQRVEYDLALVEGGLYRLVRVGRDYFLEGEYD